MMGMDIDGKRDKMTWVDILMDVSGKMGIV